MVSYTEPIERWSLPEVCHPTRMMAAIDAFITEFYGSLDRNARYAAVIESLSLEQYRHFQETQKKHLQYLLSPDLDEGTWQRTAKCIGHENFQQQIPPDWISESYRLYASHFAGTINHLPLQDAEREKLCLQLIGRLFRDLSMQAAAYAEEMEASLRLRELPTELDHLLLSVPTIAELYPRLSAFLRQTSGIDGVWLGSPDESGVVHYHFVGGPEMAEFLSGPPIQLRENPNSPLNRAWKTGVPQFAVDWTKENNLLVQPYWRERGLRFGWRSSCAIPVPDTAGPRDILVLYSKQPNFFAKSEMSQFSFHLHSLLGVTLERLRLMETLEEKNQTLTLYKSAMDASANGILISDALAEDLPIRYVNPAFERITGYTSAEAVGQNCRFLQGADTNQPQLDILREALRQGEPCSVEIKNYRKDGTMFWNALNIAPVENDAGRVTHLIGTQNDITNLKVALAKDARANALYRALMGVAELVVRAQNERELLDDLCRLLVESELFPHVWIGRPNASGDLEVLSLFSTIESSEYWYRPNVQTDDENRILTVRAWRQSKLQYSNDRLADPDYPVIQSFFREHGLRATAVVPLYRDGELWAVLTLLSREANIFNAELLELLERIGRLIGHGLDSLDLRQILEEERQHQAWLARHDALTDILNRRGLLERLEEAVARAKRHRRLLAVAVMDLDGFKIVNDLHGHPAGDFLLRTLAERLQSTLRQTDAVGRMGSDEFILILEDLDQADDLALMLSRVQAAVEGPIHLPNGRVTAVRCGMGVTLFPQDDVSPEQLLRHADRALYALRENKQEPAQRWMLFQPEADKQKYARQQTILTLFRAGKIRVHYQPIINLQTGQVSGVEALARLEDGNGNLLAPADFLGQLSSSDLVDLTHQVLAQSIHDLRRADRADFTLNVGINFEPTTLADAKAMQDLRRQIEASDLQPGRIVLELLERADTLSVAGAQQALRDLKASGARVALDDVGSAYSSLLRVKELPVDIIKLDRSFLIGLERQPDQLRFLMSLVHLVQGLGLDLVVEGIECGATYDALAALGAHQAQGYHIARPMGMDDLLLWLDAYQPVAWTKPTSLLGGIALQLSGLDATARILQQRPDFLRYMVDRDPDTECDIGSHFYALGPVANRAAAAHRTWHATMASLSDRPGGVVDLPGFQCARSAYEEELFETALEEHSQ